jgi:hypothetical protein
LTPRINPAQIAKKLGKGRKVLKRELVFKKTPGKEDF